LLDTTLQLASLVCDNGVQLRLVAISSVPLGTAFAVRTHAFRDCLAAVAWMLVSGLLRHEWHRHAEILPRTSSCVSARTSRHLIDA